jgi:hypothetical protein
MHRGANKNIRSNESGFAALIIALVLVIVLSLVTVGFAELMNNNQQQATNKQLASQAYYAAETGVNDAATAIEAGYQDAKTTCGTTGVVANEPGSQYLDNTANTKVGSSGTVSYPCLLINPTPPGAEYGSIPANNPTVVEMEGVNSSDAPQVVNSITVSWEATNGTANFLPVNNTCSSLSTSAAWPASTGMLKFTLIPINNLTRSALINEEYVAYLCPTGGNGTITNSVYSAADIGANAGVTLDGQCADQASTESEPDYCNVSVSGLNIMDATTYIMELQSIYSPVQAYLNEWSGTPSGIPLDTGQAQTLIDSTGEADGILKRIQVRLPDHNNYPEPVAAVQSMGNLCKQLALIPPSNSINYCTP